ncbi:MAG: hypothetical protein ACR2RA_19635 [Geminicoccaceae bacterium]
MDNVLTAEAPTVADEPTTVDDFEALVGRIEKFGGCSAEIHLPPPILKAHVTAHLVEEKNGVWQPTGRIVDLDSRWGLSVTFCMHGPLARVICGDLDLTASWDGYDLPEGRCSINDIRVDCNTLPCVTRVIDLTGKLTCPKDEGVYDFGICAELTDVCKKEKTIVIGVCSLQGVKLNCKHS